MKNIKSFKGVFPHDRIPAFLGNKKISLVVNYDKYGGEGTHWIAIYIDPKKAYSEIFDSYGLFPSDIIQEKLRKIGKPILYNSGRIQNLDSNRCGWYAMDYIKKRENNVVPADIIFEYMPNGSIKNDKILMKYLA
jgi:hypothetical protein